MKGKTPTGREETLVGIRAARGFAFASTRMQENGEVGWG